MAAKVDYYFFRKKKKKKDNVCDKFGCLSVFDYCIASASTVLLPRIVNNGSLSTLCSYTAERHGADIEAKGGVR